MHVQQRYFDLLKAGIKSVEFRLNDAKRRSIKVGDTIRFVCETDPSSFITLTVSDIVFSPAFETLITQIDQTLLGGIAPQQQLEELEAIYESASVQRHGVVALILEEAA